MLTGYWRGSRLRAPTKEEEEYPPSEDTFFLADHISKIRGGMALDVGSGSGYITRLLMNNFETVVGTDIIFGVLVGQSAAYRTENLVCCNGADALAAKFDLIVCNPPYLATDKITYVATDGGAGGLEVPSRILDSVLHALKADGRFVFVSTTLSDYAGLIAHAKNAGFGDAYIVARRRLFFEELLLIECTLP